MFDYTKKYHLKVDDPEKLLSFTFLSENYTENDIYYCKLESRPEIFTKISLTKINPMKVSLNEYYYIITKGSNTLQKTKITSLPEYNKSEDAVLINATIFGLTKPLSKGMVKLYIPLQLKDTEIYKLKIEGSL